MGGRFIEKVWEADLAQDTPARYRRACRYRAYVPDPLEDLELSLGLELVGLIGAAEQRIRGLNEARQLALAPVSRLLLRTESIASSKVEGLRVGARELARAEARLEAGGGRVSGRAMEVLANIDAMDLAIREAAERPVFGVAEILRIHEQLMHRSAHPHLAGRIRTVQNWIGGNDYNPCPADFVPPPPEEVRRLLDDLCVAINDDVLPPVVQAALVHAQFETIHPFEDGNGRTGRALIHVVLRRRGVAPHHVPPVSVLFARSRERYIAALARYRSDDVAGWVEHFAASVAAAATLAMQHVAAVHQLVERWRASLEQSGRPPRSDATAWRIIELLPAHPYLTASAAIAATGRSRPQVYQALEQLVAAGVLIPSGTVRRAQLYEAAGLLDQLEQLERAESTSLRGTGPGRSIGVGTESGGDVVP
jgi:Fic family protein